MRGNNNIKNVRSELKINNNVSEVTPSVLMHVINKYIKCKTAIIIDGGYN
jgi:hypothetical protein